MGGPRAFLVTLLAIELVDELVFGAREAAWPGIRTDLELSYVQIGVLLTAPALAGSALQPAIGVLGDVWRRNLLILGGGAVFTAALFVAAGTQGFWLLLAALLVLYPASGAFVGLSQASLMDTAPARHDQNMARWTFAGSVGIVLGALATGLVLALGGGWHLLFLVLALTSMLVLVAAGLSPLGVLSDNPRHPGPRPSMRDGLAGALEALTRGPVLRWLVLLEFSDLMLDGLHGYLALYFVDVARVSPSTAALAVGVWTGVGLLGDLLLIPLLERVRGLTYLRYSALAELALFPAFLMAPTVGLKMVLVGLLGLGNAGWYAVLMGRLYSSMPGRSGSVMAVSSVSGLVGNLVPLGLGVAAGLWGLDRTMWLLLAGPVALLVGIPRAGGEESVD